MKEWILKHWKGTVIFAIPVLLIFSYIWFSAKGFVPVGDALKKSDWLAFWGSFLAFTGSLFLGLTAIYQNDQATETNKKAIAENRRMSQIEFENELKRNTCLQIIDGIHQIFQRVCSIIQRLNSNRSFPFLGDKLNFLDEIIVDIELLRDLEIDNFLPSCYDDKFPELIEGKKNIKESLDETISEIKGYIQCGKESASTDNEKLTIVVARSVLLNLNSLFQERLNAISTYTSFDMEDTDNAKPAT